MSTLEVDTNVSFLGAAATMGKSSVSQNPSSSIVMPSSFIISLKSRLNESEGRATMAASTAAESKTKVVDTGAIAPSPRVPLEVALELPVLGS